MKRSLLCVVEGRGDEWEAICLDLDIAVAGRSFEGVMHDLEKAVALYMASANQEAPADRARLLNRRAPLWLRVKTVAHVLFALLSDRSGGRGESGGGFRLPCPA